MYLEDRTAEHSSAELQKKPFWEQPHILKKILIKVLLSLIA
jgi:hypothetical protein